MQIQLYCDGEARGQVCLRQEGARTEVRCEMQNPGDGLYRAVLVGERGKLPLGVMEPVGRRLILCRRPYGRDVAALGALLRGEARRSFAFSGPVCWRETDRPAQLLQSPFLQSRLQDQERAWWRRERGLLLLALPLEPGRPFPLTALFCLARVGQVEGRRCAIYAFDGQEEPVLPGKF